MAITNPLPGATVPRRSAVTIQAAASDDVGVARVEFRVNGTLLGTDTTAPYAMPWQVPGKPGATYTLSARAVDLVGNAATTSVTVTSSR